MINVGFVSRLALVVGIGLSAVTSAGCLGGPSDYPEAEQGLAKYAADLRARGLTVETVAREGYPATVIEEEVVRQGADLIVIGTRGLSGLKHLLLGSIAERVVQRAPCPVLTVKTCKKAAPAAWRPSASSAAPAPAAAPATRRWPRCWRSIPKTSLAAPPLARAISPPQTQAS